MARYPVQGNGQIIEPNFDRVARALSDSELELESETAQDPGYLVALVREQLRRSEVGRRISEARGSAGLTLHQVADRSAGMTASYLSLIESGRRLPSLSVLSEIGNALGVAPLELLIGDLSARCPLCWGTLEHLAEGTGQA